MNMTTLPRRVVVDDTDPRIQYSHQTWKPGAFAIFPGDPKALTPRDTVHIANGTTVEVTNLSFQFRGFSPLIFGYTPQVQHECSVNGTGIGAAPTTPLEGLFSELNSGLLCDGTQFTEEGEYTLTLNVSASLPSGSEPLVFDYITYIPPASARVELATVLIDKSDPAISYVGNWTTIDASYDSAIFTQTIGSRLIFNFTGTSVSWIGFIPTQPVGANLTYSIDGGKSILLSLQPSPLNNMSNNIFFTSSNLQSGPHSLVVENTGEDTGAPLALNNFVVNNGSALTPSPIPLPIASSVPTPNTSTNGPTSGATIPIGAIIGGAIGGIAVLCIASFLAWRRNLQRRNSQNGGIGIDPGNTTVQITPFDCTMPFNPAPKVRGRIPKGMNPFEANLDSSPDVFPDSGDTGAAQRAPGQNLNALAESMHEDGGSVGGAVSGGGEATEPPPSYFSHR